MLTARGKRVLIAAVAALLCVAIPTTTGVAAKKRQKFIFRQARVLADGLVTPGQLETIQVSRLAPKTPIKVFVEAPPITVQCGELYFCDPAPTSPAPGTPANRSSGKGRATLTFVMPGEYYLEIDPFKPSQRQPVKWMNGQAVHIDVAATSKTKRVIRQSFGFARAVVQLPPS